MLTGKNYIGNQSSAEGFKTYKTFNPELNAENSQLFVEANEQEVNQAVTLAAKAFKSYRNISKDHRALFLKEIANQILILDDQLINMFVSESGLTRERAISERLRTVNQLRDFADLLEEGDYVEASIDVIKDKNTFKTIRNNRKMLIPLGPVVVFGASNFPLAYSTAGGDTASALAAGCPVIVKSHPMHSGTGELVASAVVKAAIITNMPNGVFSNLNSSGIDVGQQLVKHPEVKAVGFTGSIAGGRALFDAAAQRDEPIPVFAEMGSINPTVFFPKALGVRSAELAKTFAKSLTTDSGQFCTNPGLLIGIKSQHLNRFAEELGREILNLNPSCMLHPNIYKAYHDKKAKAISQDNLKVVATFSSSIRPNYADQTLTTVDAKVFIKNKQLRQEVFGPYTILVQCEDFKEIEQVLLNLEGQLTGTIIAEDGELANHLGIVEALKNRVGRIIYNGVPTGVEVCPSMAHGGPYPASTDSRFTAVGIHSIKRWLRPISYQNWPNELLPDDLKDENPKRISRLLNGQMTIASVKSLN